jgi:hypothetical protein
VCQKVEQKKVTTYNEVLLDIETVNNTFLKVADELVTEFTTDVQVDQVNIPLSFKFNTSFV